MSEERSRRAGGPPGAILMRVGLKDSSSIQLAYFGEFLGTAGGRKKKGAPVLRTGREERTGGGLGGSTKEGDEHVPPGLFVQRLRSMPTRVPCFGLDPALNSQQREDSWKL